MGLGQYRLDDDLYPLLEQLDREVAFLREKRPLNEQVLQRMQDYFRAHHVYHSNAIEGNSLTLAETELVIREGLTVSGKPMKDHLEAINLNFAINYVEDLVKKKEPVTERVIQEMHQMILRQIDDANAGRYRKIPVMIGGSEFRPPEPIKVQECMDEFIQWYESSAPEHSVVKAAKAHTWLVEIHPFIDGNGRTCRLLMNLHLLMNDYPIAIIRQEERPRYYNALELSHQGDLSPFVELVIERVRTTLNEYLRAIQEDERAREWAKNLAERSMDQKIHANANHQIWASRIEYLINEFNRKMQLLREQQKGGKFSDFEFSCEIKTRLNEEQYQKYIENLSNPRAWAFRLGINKKGVCEEKFTFYYCFSSNPVKDYLAGKLTVSLRPEREESTGRRLADKELSLREVFVDTRSGFLGQLRIINGKPVIEQVTPSECAVGFIDEVLEIFFNLK